MPQKLIVEGNDAIVLAELCKLSGLNPPVGYETYQKFKSEFIAIGGGYEKALNLLEITIQQSDLSNIGIIVDANDAGPIARWQAIRKVLATKFSASSLESADAQATGKVISEEGLPTVGVWIMPDNLKNGYLEHFLANLVPSDDALWFHAQKVLNDLRALSFNEITETKAGKAHLHTWLAWKKDPGKPFGASYGSQVF